MKDYMFLETEAEGYALYASVLCYLLTIALVLSRYLKIVRDKKRCTETVRVKKRKVYVQAVAGLLICALIHAFLFVLFFSVFPDEENPETSLRLSYLFSILLTLGVFSLLMAFGMFLKGTSTLPKHQGPVSGV